MRSNYRLLALAATIVVVSGSFGHRALGQASRSGVISNISYVNWSSATLGSAGRASGIVISNLLQSIAVTYQGEVAPATQVDDSGGVNYWIPPTPYLNLAISNLPPTRDLIALSENSVGNVLSFSEPVVDPILLIVSLGRAAAAVTYTFDASFDILSQGPGYWGTGTLFASEPNVLLGQEGHGAIQFRGTYSSLSWDVDGPENWHGFTVGIPVDPTARTAVHDGGMGSPICLLAGVAFVTACRRRFRA